MARTPLFRQLARLASGALQQRLTRREFLQAGVAVSLSAVFLPAWAEKKITRSTSSPETVVIVGAGLAGLTTAWHLMRQGVACEIYEASPRVGGRMHTQRNFNEEDMFCELGGELVDTDHTEIIQLCRVLGVPLERFDADTAQPDRAVFYAQGRIYTEEEVLEAFQPLARVLAADIARCFPGGEVMIPTYRESYNAAWLDGISLAEYLDSKKQVAPWLVRIIKNAYTGEYGLDPEEQSALNLLLMMKPETERFRMFGDSDEAMRIQGGSSQLPQALLKAISGKVPVHYRHRLQAVSAANNGMTLAFQDGGHTRMVNAQRVVMAIPFSVLRDVQGINELGLSPIKKRCIRELGYGTNAKQMIGFRSRFWRKTQQRVPANSGEFFTDWLSQCYWDTSRLPRGKAGILTNFLGGKAGELATSAQYNVALKDLQRLYPGGGKQADGNQAFFNWARFVWSKGSYTCCRPGQYTSIIGVAQEPELDGRLFFAGEHCSVDWMGYMNGAAESGRTAAAQVMRQVAVVSAGLLAVNERISVSRL